MDGTVSKWLREAAHARRALMRRPLLSIVIVVTLGVALASNVTIFTVIDALLLRPFRGLSVERVLVLSSGPENDPLADRTSVAPADLQDWMRDSHTLERFSAAEFWDPNLSDIGEPEQVPGFRVTAGFFRTIVAEPLLGRTFTDDEDQPGAARRVVLSYALWMRRYGGDASILGRTVRVNSEPYEIVGVMPQGLAVPFGAEIWAPLGLNAQDWTERRRGGLLVLAALVQGASFNEARAEMRALVERQRRDHPDTNATREVRV